MIQIQGPDGSIINFPDGTAPAVIRDAMARHYGGEGATRSFGAPQTARAVPLPPPPPGPHPQSEDWWRSTMGGLTNGVNNVAASVGAAYDTEDRLAEMAAHGIHDAGQAVGWVPKDQPYKPGQGLAVMHTVRDPAELAAAAAGAFGADQKTQQGVRDTIHTVGAYGAPGAAWSHVHPSDVRNAELSTARAVGGPNAAGQVSDVVDYQPQTAAGRVLYRGAAMAPAALLPGSAARRALSVLVPTVGATVGGEGARAFGVSPQTESNAELIGGLLAAGAGAKGVPLAERAVTNAGDMITGPRAVPVSGDAADLVTMLRGGAGGPIGEDAPTFRRSDLQGAANVLQQHVRRVSRANGEDFAGMSQRVSDMGLQGMLADALPDLARNVADRGSFGQQFLGQQLNQRQLGVRDPTTGAWTNPSQSMRLQDAYAGALGIPEGVSPFDYLKSIENDRNAAAATNYKSAYAQHPVPVSAPPGNNVSPLWSNLANAQPAPAPDLPFSAYAESPAWNEAYARARKISGVEPLDNGDGTFSIQELPKAMPDTLDWRTLDLMKRGIGDMVDEAPSKGLGSTYAGMLGDYLKRLTSAQGELNPDLSAARADYAAPSQLMDAATLGSTFRNGTISPSEVAWHLSQSDPNRTIGLQVGHYNSAQPIFDGSTRFNAAERLGATSPGAFEKDNLLIGDPGAAADWQRLLGNENTFFNTRNRALGGSATSRNLLGSEDSAEGEGVNPIEAGAGAIRALHGDLDGVVETGGNLGKLAGIQKLFAPKPSQMTEGTADVLGTVLGTRGAFMDPQTAALIQGLMDSAQGPNYSAGIIRPAALLSAPKNQDQGGNIAP